MLVIYNPFRRFVDKTTSHRLSIICEIKAKENIAKDD